MSSTRVADIEPEVLEYLRLGLALGRHVDGFVDAYYGPAELADEASAQMVAPGEIAARARRLLAELGSGLPDLDPARRQWIAAQVRGLMTSALRLAGEEIAYLDEIEACYGVRPSWMDEDRLAEAHARLSEVLPGPSTSDLAERYNGWREAQVVPPEVLGRAVGSLAEDFRQRTAEAFGLPEGEQVDFEMATSQPWSGFNYYLGGLRSRVAVNIDLPVLSIGLGHLVAHESYPGHHTEHCRKEAGLVRRRRQMEESIKLVGTPECLVSEGLADLGLEVIAGERPEPVVESHLGPLGVPYEAGTVATVARAAESLGSVRGNAAIGLHDRRWTEDQAVEYIRRWALLPDARARKAVSFLVDPTWRAYPFCYIDGLRLCRSYVAGDPSRFERLITEQVLPSQLVTGPSGS